MAAPTYSSHLSMNCDPDHVRTPSVLASAFRPDEFMRPKLSEAASDPIGPLVFARS